MASIYFKDNGAWINATHVYRKINGSWVEQTDISTVLKPDTKYVPRSKLSYLINEDAFKLAFGNDRILIYTHGS